MTATPLRATAPTATRPTDPSQHPTPPWTRPAPPRSPAARWRRRLVDVTVLTWRNLAHIAREPLQLSDVTVQPVLFTLLFVYVFGSGVAIAGSHSAYKQYALAGLLALNLTTSSIGTAVGLSQDLSTGVIDRFRTLPMWRPAVLVARSVADLATAAVCAAIVAVTGLAIGWRPHGSVGGVIGGFALFLLFSYALSWGCACLGLVSKGAEAAQGIGLVVLFPLAIVSDALVPTQHMPTVLRAIANWNPVSALTTAARHLWDNPNPAARTSAWPMQHPELASLLWSLALLAVFVPLAIRLYRRRTTG
jgi:ABC-2 type transport system permease protein